jgi:hypothetical protein
MFEKFSPATGNHQGKEDKAEESGVQGQPGLQEKENKKLSPKPTQNTKMPF